MKQISIFIPVYNEEEIIIKNTRILIAYLTNIKQDYEIVIVDNGSTDNTIKLGKQLDKDFKKLK